MAAWPTHCRRCGADLAKTSSIMSKFNTDTICSGCKSRERAHPNYRAADEAEVAAVRAGVLNFPGVGAPADLFRPPCGAEQFLLQASQMSGPQAYFLALELGGITQPDTDANTDLFAFPDGSQIHVTHSAPLSFSVIQYANS